MKNCCNPRIIKLWIFLTGGFLLQSLLGCQSQSRHYSSVPMAEHSPPASVALMSGDVVEVKFFYTPQLNEIQTVRPDGKIALQLVGEVEAQEMTPAELRTELMRLYTPHLKDPNITVIVRSFFNRRVFVGGQVMKPGVVEMPGRLTALEAIIQAGGFDMRDAELQNVIVIRHKNGQRYAYSINMKLPQKEGEIQPFYLEQQDIVYVPQTEIAKVGQWVDQHINKLIPRTGFIFLTTGGTNTIGIDTSSR